jgi:hypothetical protein
MKILLTFLFLFFAKLLHSQSYINLNKTDIIALKGSNYKFYEKENSISYIVATKSTDGYPSLPNIENFRFNQVGNVIGYVHLVNDAPESFGLQLIQENNSKYEKVSPEEGILFKWVDRKNLLVIRIGWITRDSNGLYSVHYEIDKVSIIK